MNVVGVDLAWSSTGRGRTGVCVVRGGQAVTSVVVRSDDEIVTALAPFLDAEPWLFAVDAPLIVRNRCGQRPCERSVSSLFGRYHAGAHSSNTQRSAFRDGSRGERLAQLLAAEIRTDGPPLAGRRAIEVYPHPALVTLFGLDRALAYKARVGRTLASRRSELLRLRALLELLRRAKPALDVRASDRWLQLGLAVATAQSGAALDRAEDELDAYTCAYIGLFHATHGPHRSHVFGDLDSGFIVVPLASALDPSVPHEVAARLPGNPLGQSAASSPRRRGRCGSPAR